MVMGLISWIVVGAIGGWLAGFALSRDTGFDLMDVVIGMLGAIVGGWVVGFLGIDNTGISIGAIIAAFVGAVILAWLYKMITGRSAV